MGNAPRDDPGMVRTKAKPRTKRVDLREDIVRGMEPLPQGRARVDREKGIIYGVKILGEKSLNNRRYTPEARRQAVEDRIYEGLAVYEDHPAKPGDPRPVRSKFGRIVNVRLYQGDPYGDLEYLKSHPAAALICEAAERMPEQFGLSHNAKGEGEDLDGEFVVYRITDARSVDVVTEPATTDGFFEQRAMKTIKIKQLFESSWKKFSRKTTKRPRLAKFMKELLEDDATMSGETTGDVPEDHEEALRGGFQAAIGSVVEDCLNGGDAKAGIKRIGELLKAHGKLTEGDDEQSDDMEEEEPGKKEDNPDAKGKADEKKDEAQEQRLRIDKIERENLINKEARKAGVVLDDDLMESLLSVSDPKAIKKLLEREKAKKPAANGGGPRSGAADGGGKQQDTLEGVDTPEGFLAALMH